MNTRLIHSRSHLCRFLLILVTGMIPSLILSGCDNRVPAHTDPKALANELEESLFQYILEPWYPRVIDTLNDGYISNSNNDWSHTDGPKDKALVQQARHLWATSYIYGHYPQKEEYKDYSTRGYRFIRDHFWDPEHGGFHYAVREDGSRNGKSIMDKQTYGQAFAIYGLSQYNEITGDLEAVNLALDAFQWMEEHCYDPVYGGYFDLLHGDGTPKLLEPGESPGTEDLPSVGLKEYNSSIHIMEAFAKLYEICPDSLVGKRLEAMFYLVRDTFVHPDGFEQLYFYPDWTLVPEEVMEERSPDNYWYTQHVSFCHDVEVAYLLLETAHALGFGEDEKTHSIAKRMVDFALEYGWDTEYGGFFYAGKRTQGEMEIIDDRKPWWGQSEGLNALVLMHSLHPDDPNDYLGKALQLWEYIDNHLIDKEHGGWYNFGTDRVQGTATSRKSHWWKTTFHNVRGMGNSIRLLKSM